MKIFHGRQILLRSHLSYVPEDFIASDGFHDVFLLSLGRIDVFIQQVRLYSRSQVFILSTLRYSDIETTYLTGSEHISLNF